MPIYRTFVSNKYDMEVITIDSKAYKELIEKIDSIADYIRNKNIQDISEELDEVWVDSYEVCTFLRISERTLQRLRTNNLISYSTLSGKTYYSIGEIKRILTERLVRSGDRALEDLVKSHQEYIETRKKNKPNK